MAAILSGWKSDSLRQPQTASGSLRQPQTARMQKILKEFAKGTRIIK